MFIRHASEAEDDRASVDVLTPPPSFERPWSSMVERKRSFDDTELGTHDRERSRKYQTLVKLSARLAPAMNASTGRRLTIFLRGSRRDGGGSGEVEATVSKARPVALSVSMYPRYSRDEFEFDMADEVEAETMRRAKKKPTTTEW